MDAEGRPAGRSPVGLEQSAGPVADPREAASYITDLSADNAAIRDMMDPNRGREHAINPYMFAEARRSITTVGEANPIPTSIMPMLKPVNVTTFYQHKSGRVYLKMHPPGDKLQIIDRPATEADKKAYPREWQRFRDGQDQHVKTLDQLPSLRNHPGKAKPFYDAGIYTPHHAATLSDEALATVPGAPELAQESQAYLASQQLQIDALKIENAELKRQLEAMKSRPT